ncbi:MAG: endonuclease dU [Candidatus Heimdallarchaeota archaeon]
MVRTIKKGVKIIGIACSSFNREKEKTVPIVGVIYRGKELFEGMLTSTITVDGEDATKTIIEMVTKSTHYEQLKAIFTRGVTIGGFNYIDLEELARKTNLPVISIVDHQPDMAKIEKALKNLPNGQYRWGIIQKNGPPKAVRSNPKEEPVYVQFIGLSQQEAHQLIQNATVTGRIPEPLRIARLIAIALRDYFQ